MISPRAAQAPSPQEPSFADENVYQMSERHHGSPFWLRRVTWHRHIARVIEIGPKKGPPPYFGDPGAVAEIWTTDGTLVDARAVLSAPGTFKTWREIPPPPWSKDTPAPTPASGISGN